MQQDEPAETPGASPCLVVESAPGALLGALVLGLVEQHFPFERVAWEQTPAIGADSAVVTNRQNGRTLWILARATGTVPAGCSAIHLATNRADVSRALQSLEEGPVFVAPELLGKPLDLTAREREIAVLVARGLGNEEIAGALQMSPHTVRTHLKAMSLRLGVTSRARLAARVRDLGLEA